ncbi:MAG TPA: palindromic element RPE4 domain-containing protein [Rickettsia endosymbiont of Columbicola hoogstraali]|nr:palindromic element RPE4 domain-containing protein [Rickettsia endosymbiont of Columbicola hoogstraali]
MILIFLIVFLDPVVKPWDDTGESDPRG